jgi:transposase
VCAQELHDLAHDRRAPEQGRPVRRPGHDVEFLHRRRADPVEMRFRRIAQRSVVQPGGDEQRRRRDARGERRAQIAYDEKSSVQALDRTQPSLPMTKGRAATMTRDYKRNGTTTLFAALDVLTGKVIGQCQPRHRRSEFLRFLRKIDREVPKGLQVHLICDNYATHKHPEVKAWLAKHRRFHMHFTPTSSSWLNLIERWFRELTDKALRRGVFHSVPDLIAKIEEYLVAHNDDPKPFIWTATADDILAKVARGRVALQAVNQ